MSNIYMKFHFYDERSGTFIVSFASDETKSQNPDDYEKVAFQAFEMWPDVNDVSQFPILIARAGQYQVERTKRQEKLVVDTQQIAQAKALEGQIFTYTTEELTPNDPPLV